MSIAESDRHASLRSDGASTSTPKAGAGAGAEAGAGAGASGVDAGMPMFKNILNFTSFTLHHLTLVTSSYDIVFVLSLNK